MNYSRIGLLSRKEIHKLVHYQNIIQRFKLIQI